MIKIICMKCKNTFYIEDWKLERIYNGEKIECPYCKKEIGLKEEV